MRVIVDNNRCTGLGMCEAAAPEFFAVRDDGSLELLRDEAGEDLRAELEEAVSSCPTEALRIEA